MGSLRLANLLLLADHTGLSVQVCSAGMAIGLVGLGLVLYWRERRRWPEQPETLSDEDLEFVRGRYRRRLTGSLFMAAAGLLVFLGGAVFTPETPTLFVGTWLTLLVFVAGMVVVALLDMMATRRYALNQLRRLTVERAALLLAKEQAETHLAQSGSEADRDGDQTEPAT